jgi:hypothetical protein
MKFTTKVSKAFAGKPLPDTSPALKVDTTDMAKVIRTGALMGIATAVVYGLSNLNPEIFGDYAGLAAVIIAMVTEGALRFIKDNQKGL